MGALLAVELAACSADTSTKEEKQPLAKAALATTDSAARLTTSVDAPAGIEHQAEDEQKVVQRAVASPALSRQGSSNTVQQQAKAKQQRSRAALPLATVADAGAGQADSLRDFLKPALPKGQNFVLRPGRDTVIFGTQGTRILVTANAWDLPAGRGLVRLKLHEFYTLSDMLLAGLTTTADGLPL